MATTDQDRAEDAGGRSIAGWVLIGLVVAAAIAAVFLFKGSPPPAAGELVVCSYGGSFQDAQRKAFFEGFERETGIKVREAQWSGEFAKLKAMTATGNPEWDLVTAAESSIIIRGAREGILEKIDYSKIDRSRFMPQAVTEYSLAFDYYSTVLGFDTRKFPAGAGPTTWADFWDTGKFPGARSLRKDPRTTLEFALLADGVAPAALYPLDVDRAFRSLDRLKRTARVVWWSSGHQPAQLLSNGEVTMASSFNGRIWAAATNDKVPLDVSWHGGSLDVDAWIIPKGAKNYKQAMMLIEYTCRPEIQNELTKYINYGPTMPEAYATLDAAARAVLPNSPENLGKHFFFNAEWWADNEAAVLERWNKWLLNP